MVEKLKIEHEKESKLKSNLTSQIISRVNVELIAILIIKLDSSLNGGSVSAVAFEGTIDGTNGGTEALVYDRPHKVHPVPQCRLERHHRVGGNDFRVVQAIESDVLPCGAIVEVPR